MKNIRLWNMIILVVTCFALIGCNEEKREVTYKNGKLKESYYVKNIEGKFLKNGVYTRWYPDGVKAEELRYKKGKKSGHYVDWYKNRVKKSEGNYINDEKDGAWTTWFTTNEIKMSASYNKGKRSGEWIRYKDQGDVLVKVNFNNSQIEGKIDYEFIEHQYTQYEHKFKLSCTLKDGIPVGEFKIVEKYGKNNMMAAGKFLDNGTVEFTEKKNIEIAADGKITILFQGEKKTFDNFRFYILKEINDEVMKNFIAS